MVKYVIKLKSWDIRLSNETGLLRLGMVLREKKQKS